MTGRYARHSKVMTIANRLVKQGYNRANAMVKAWALVKMPQLLTKVSGVTFGKRQKAIEHLKRYAPELVTISLYRDTRNAYDQNGTGQGQLYNGLYSKSSCSLYSAAD